MTDETKPKIENLELNKETVEDLSEPDAAEVRGGLVKRSTHADCTDACPSTEVPSCPLKTSVEYGCPATAIFCPRS